MRPEIRDMIEFVPSYEVGLDFFTQCKPPHDGGYSTLHYDEFLRVGDCSPPLQFPEQIAQLRRQINLELGPPPLEQMGKLVDKVIRATFLAPCDSVFWLDDGKWAVFQPKISATVVQEWMRFATS